MNLTASELADKVSGKLVHGDGTAEISGVASLRDAQSGTVAFFGNRKYLPDLKATGAGTVIVPNGTAGQIAEARPDLILIEAANPSVAFDEAVRLLTPAPWRQPAGIHPSAIVDPSAELAPDAVSIGPGAVVEAGAVIGKGTSIGGNCHVGAETRIGEDCLLHAGAIVRERCLLGNRVILQSGVVVGGDGFGYELVEGRHRKIEQTGIVQIDDDVEIGANSTVDRARFGRTWIQEGAKIDNLVMIAHNCVIGKHTILVAQVGMSGSSKTGEYCVLGGQAGVAGHIEMGDRAIVGGRTAVTHSIPGDETYMGFPIDTAKNVRRRMMIVKHLPELSRKVKALEKRIKDLEG